MWLCESRKPRGFEVWQWWSSWCIVVQETLTWLLTFTILIHDNPPSLSISRLITTWETRFGYGGLINKKHLIKRWHMMVWLKIIALQIPRILKYEQNLWFIWYPDFKPWSCRKESLILGIDQVSGIHSGYSGIEMANTFKDSWIRICM